MSPLTVFLRTLAKSTAIFLGAGVIFLNPSLISWQPRGHCAEESRGGGRRRAHRRAEGFRRGRSPPGRALARPDAQRARGAGTHRRDEGRERGSARSGHVGARRARGPSRHPRDRRRAEGQRPESARTGRVGARRIRGSGCARCAHRAPFATATSTCGRTSSGRSARLATPRALPALTEAMKDADAPSVAAILAIAEISDGEDGHHGSAHPHPMPMPNPMPMPMPNPNPNPNPHPNPHNLRTGGRPCTTCCSPG